MTQILFDANLCIWNTENGRLLFMIQDKYLCKKVTIFSVLCVTNYVTSFLIVLVLSS